jgi:large subunit ribosomal protein L35
MPKMKTRRGLKGRFRLTASGKVKRQSSHFIHILTKKSSKRKRQLRGTTLVSAADTPRMRRMLGH